MWPHRAQRADELGGEQEGGQTVRGHQVHRPHRQAENRRHPHLQGQHGDHHSTRLLHCLRRTSECFFHCGASLCQGCVCAACWSRCRVSTQRRSGSASASACTRQRHTCQGQQSASCCQRHFSQFSTSPQRYANEVCHLRVGTTSRQ